MGVDLGVAQANGDERFDDSRSRRVQLLFEHERHERQSLRKVKTVRFQRDSRICDRDLLQLLACAPRRDPQ